MDVEIKIYINKIKNFFEANPEDLRNLIPLEKKELFFEELEKISMQNLKNYGHAELYDNQISFICERINNSGPIIKTEYGEICLN
jgi:hypothetical protein